MTDLDKLIAAVESGGWPDRQTEVAAFYSGGSISACNEHAGLARQANAGSLDAALRLHEALLPDHTPLMFGDGVQVHPSASSIISGDYIVVPGTPARAWLLAILRALKAKGDA